jgi:hypothetical protein
VIEAGAARLDENSYFLGLDQGGNTFASLHDCQRLPESILCEVRSGNRNARRRASACNA